MTIRHSAAAIADILTNESDFEETDEEIEHADEDDSASYEEEMSMRQEVKKIQILMKETRAENSTSSETSSQRINKETLSTYDRD